MIDFGVFGIDRNARVVEAKIASYTEELIDMGVSLNGRPVYMGGYIKDEDGTLYKITDDGILNLGERDPNQLVSSNAIEYFIDNSNNNSVNVLNIINTNPRSEWRATSDPLNLNNTDNNTSSGGIN